MQIQATYDKFPTTIGNALERISTQWQILIGSMDQANGASATVAQWLVMLADNMGIVETLLNDIGSGFIWVGEQLTFIDVSVFETLKSALSSTYDAVKDVIATLVDFGKTIVDILGTSLSNVLAVLSSFTGEATTAAEQVSFLERTLQGLSIAFGFVADGAAAIKIGVNLLAGAFFDLASAANSVLAAVTWGDVSKQFAANADVMKGKAKQYYEEAENDALKFQSKGLQRLEESARTEEEKNANTLIGAKNLVDQLLLENQREVDGKKVTEQEKLNAIQAYAEAAITANKGVMDGTMQADLMTKGYIVTMDEAGKVSVTAWDAAAAGADKASGSADRARKAAVALGLDLDVALNRVSDKFTASQKSLNDFALGLEKLGIKGQQAAEVTYQAWVKWLETTKSQAEIDLATAKLQEFGNKGQISAKQVELGMRAIRQVVQKIPDDLNPVEQAFERLGIKTKEQLKLAAQSALADFNTIQSSGQATAESLRQAYERTMQAAAASGDQAVISASQAKAASLGLQVQIDSTGKASVKSMDDWTNANYRVRNSADGIGDGFRNAGQVARDEASSASDAWQKAVKAAESAMHATPQGSRAKMAYSAADIEEKLKAMGYDEAQAKRLANEVYQGSRNANGTGYKQTVENWSFAGGGGGMSNVDVVNKELERLAQYANSNAVKSAAPSVKTSTVAVETSSDPKTTIRIEANGKSVDVQANSKDKDALSEILATLGTLKKST